MKKTILTEKDYNLFYKLIIYGNIDKPLLSCINLAYRDVCRTITGFSKYLNHDSVYKNAVDILNLNIEKLLKLNISSQIMFDEWHKNLCDDLILCFEKQPFSYGQAQKWINMTLKYVSMMEHKKVVNIYEFFHVPIDNYIIIATDYKFDKAWSRINNYDCYNIFQKWFRDNYKGIPLDVEFKMWLTANKKI